MYFGTLYFGPTANTDYFGSLFFGPPGTVPHGVSMGRIEGGGWMPGLEHERVHPWLIRERHDEEIIAILNAIMRIIEN